MRSTLRRAVPLALVAAGLVALTFSDPEHVHAQALQPAIKPGPRTDDPNAPKPEGFQAFTFPEDRDAKQRLKAVTDYLDKKTVPWDVVCGTAQQLLDARSDSFYPTEAAGDAAKGAGSRVSVKAKVNDLIGHFPKDGRQFYELTYGPTADALLKDAVQNHYDKPALADVSQRFFHTRSGARAALLIATLDLETGNYAEAGYGFRRLLDRPESDDVLTPRTLYKAAVAFKRSGDPRQAGAVAAIWDRLAQSFPRDGLAFGRRTYSLDELKTELARSVEGDGGPAGERFVAMRYGNPSHTGRGVGGTPFLDPAYGQSMMFAASEADRHGAEWVRQHVALAYKSLDRAKGQVAIPGFFPITAENRIVFRTYDRVFALATKSGTSTAGQPYAAGDVLWNSTRGIGGGGGAQTVQDRLHPALSSITEWWQSYWQYQMPSVLFENAQVGTLSHDGKLVYFIDDLAIPPQPTNLNQSVGGFPGNVRGAPTTDDWSKAGGMVASNRLMAIDIESGKETWSLGRASATTPSEQDEEKLTDAGRLTENALFLGPPLPLNGKLYALYERNGQIRLACLDPGRTTRQADGSLQPEWVWSQNLGAATNRLSQDSLRRIQPAFLAYADGVLICPTNAGAVVAVDVNARSLLWARYYVAGTSSGPMVGEGVPGLPGVRIRPARGGWDVPNTHTTLPRDRWRAAAPIVAGGKVVLTAHDSEQLQCLDLRTGDLLWATPRMKDDLYVGGVIDDKVVVVGKETVRAYTLSGGPKQEAVAAWPAVRIGTPCGHGATGTDGVYYLPVVGNPDRKDAKQAEVWAIDTATGQVKSKTAFRHQPDQDKDPRTALGNLLFHDGQLFSQSAAELTAFPLSELKKAEMAQRLKANPRDPEGLFARGELSLDEGAFKDAILDFKEAEKNNPPDATRHRLRDKLHAAITELLRAKFADGEPYLKEYEALCELPVDTDDPAEKQRLMDEQDRRRGLYLTLLAKGREAQGRLGDAFDAYREYAAWGHGKQLVPVADDAAGSSRPDVWARGRIDAMIRGATDPAARKPLEDRVAAEWAAARSGNDLNTLREFVTVFGPYFPAGRDAQLLLAERLLGTNNDDDLREAQTQLMQLWASADDPVAEARAVEALARVLLARVNTHPGLTEDAVALYALLGTRYAAVPVRDGKTGADVYAEIVTDKRLLPYLEPSRAGFGRYKVESAPTTPNRGGIGPQGFVVRPDGDPLPFLRRLALTVEPAAANPGEVSYQLRVTDRATGEEWCKFGGLAGVQQMLNVNTGVPADRVARASGHLLLVNAGAYAYCFDLAEKRKRWEYHLLGAAPPGAGNGPQVRASADGDVEFEYEDGWRLRLGRSSVLQPTYACLVTQDGLVALDPVTGQKLWVRSNVSKRVQVFGDARHVFVVDGNGSRVLRAVDGSPVEGVKDFSDLATGSSRIGLFGRHLLLNEGGGETRPRVLRLYDPLTGRDVWRKEYPAKTLLLRTHDHDLTGCLLADGTFEVLAARTGATLLKGSLDANQRESHMTGNGGTAVTAPVLLADSERFYLFLNRGSDPGQQGFNRFAGGPSLRTVAVNGAAYAFDRTSGARLWYTDTLFENQQLILDRFEELPVLVAASGKRNPITDRRGYVVAVVDKQLGKLRLYDSYPEQAFFMAVATDPKTRATEFVRFDVKVRVVPDDGSGGK